MAQHHLSDAIALRIGVAARELPGVDVGQLLEVVIDVVGIPITATKLDRLTLARLRSGADGQLTRIPHFQLLRALSFLNGATAIQTVNTPLPEVEPYHTGDLPGSIRVAVASNDGERLDADFATSKRFLVYQVAADSVRLVAIREIPPVTGRHAWRSRIPVLADCQLVIARTISTPTDAALVAHRIHTIQTLATGPARDFLSGIQRALDKPAPWLAKASGQTPPRKLHHPEAVLALCA